MSRNYDRDVSQNILSARIVFRREIVIALVGVVLGVGTFFPARARAQDLGSVCSTLATQIKASGRKTIAVVDFTDLTGKVTDLGRYLS